MWWEEGLLYQIYPLGMCGAPRENDGVTVSRILAVENFIPHMQRLGATGVYFSPLFESLSHGYDTTDFRCLDRRLGTNEDFRRVCNALRDAGIRVILDGVFNHVGRGFAPFRDVCERRWDSPYRDWFCLHDGDTPYHDGFHYDCWEGHYELVKLNLRNPAVRAYLLDAVRFWRSEFGISGLRLDVAYCLDHDFMRELRQLARELGEEFVLIGEVLFGDYNLLVRDDMLHSCTNYENHKSLWSAINSKNLFELSYSLNRQFGYEQWCIYRGRHLVTFLDNHDVSRIASQLTDKTKLPLAWTLLMTQPGVPTVYYGSEWGVTGEKSHGDNALRPAIEAPAWNSLTDHIAQLAAVRRETPALVWGGYRNLVERNTALLFERACEGSRALVGVNIGDTEEVFRHASLVGTWRNALTNEKITLDGSLTVAAGESVVVIYTPQA